MKAKSVGLYVHIPFCLSKCAYCDFCSFSTKDESLIDGYVNALCNEIYSYREKGISVDTVFFGGGTPSLLSPDSFKKIVNSINFTFDLSELSEFTVEVNPKTLSRDKLLQYISCGVNRISIGMQSIHENELKKIGRIHNYSDFLNTYKLCRELGISNINVDIMYGIPDQTVESFKSTLEQIVSLKPEHLSVYSLIVEPGTPLSENINALDIPDDDCVFDMYQACCSLLSSKGYEHYEISNFALPTFDCKHNLKYWNTDEYIGVGLSAHSYFDDCRFSNTATKDDERLLIDYIKGQFTHTDRTVIDINDAIYEYVMLRLRLKNGIVLSSFKEKFGFDFLSGREDKIKRFANLGLAALTKDVFSLTEQGLFLSNAILVELL